jgi:hypothetical protein
MTPTAQAIATAVPVAIAAAKAAASANIMQALWTAAGAVGAAAFTHLGFWLKSQLTPTNEVAALQIAQTVLTTSGHPAAAQAVTLVGQVIAAKNAQLPGA